MTEEPTPDGPRASLGWTRERIVLLAITGGLFVILMIAVREVLLPFLLAIVIAYVLMPVVALAERTLRLPRSVAIVAAYAVVLGSAYGLLAMTAPRLVEEAARLARDAPSMLRHAARSYGPEIDRRVNAYFQTTHDAKEPDQPPRDAAREPSLGPADQPPDGSVGGVQELPGRRSALLVRPLADGAFAVDIAAGIDILQEGQGRYRIAQREQMDQDSFQVTVLLDQGVDRLLKYIEGNVVEFVKLGQTVVARAARGIFLLFMVLMVAGYLMQTSEQIIGFLKSLAPARYRPSCGFLLSRIDRGLSGVVRGQLIICLVNGVLSAFGFWMFGLNYWPLLALVAAVLSIIPIFGAILSTVPAVFVGLTQDIWTAVWVLVWVIGIHQVEANLLNPKIIGASAKVHPVLVIFSLLVGEHFFGIWGAVLAVPALSLTQSIFNHFRFGLEDAPPDSFGVLAPTAGRKL